MPIFQNKHIEISKKKDSFILNIKQTENNKKASRFWEKTSSLIDYQKKTNIQIQFDADSIETLPSLLKTKKKKLSYRHCELLFKNFLSQIKSLEKDGLGIVNLDLNDFIIINKEGTRYDSCIIFINVDKFHKLENNHFNLKKPSQISKLIGSKFVSPEVKNIKDIPAKIHKKTIFYSIAKLITFCINDEHKLDEKADYELSLESIYESKLYYGLMRCIENNPHERYYLYI